MSPDNNEQHTLPAKKAKDREVNTFIKRTSNNECKCLGN